jgi:hypothetical protein
MVDKFDLAIKGGIIAAVIGLGYFGVRGLQNVLAEPVKNAEEFVNNVGEELDKAVESTGEFFTNIGDEVTKHTESASQWFSDVTKESGEAAQVIAEQISEAATATPEAVATFSQELGRAISGDVDGVSESFNDLLRHGDDGIRQLAGVFYGDKKAVSLAESTAVAGIPLLSESVLSGLVTDVFMHTQNIQPLNIWTNQPVKAYTEQAVSERISRAIGNQQAGRYSEAFGGYGSAVAQEIAFQQALSESMAKYPEWFKGAGFV